MHCPHCGERYLGDHQQILDDQGNLVACTECQGGVFKGLWNTMWGKNENGSSINRMASGFVCTVLYFTLVELTAQYIGRVQDGIEYLAASVWPVTLPIVYAIRNPLNAVVVVGGTTSYVIVRGVIPKLLRVRRAVRRFQVERQLEELEDMQQEANYLTGGK